MQSKVLEIINESIAVKRLVAEQLSGEIVAMAKALVKTYQQGGKLLLFGNGGSAADAQHIAGELVHQFELPRRKCLLAIALNVNSTVVTAIGNDWSFDEIFERQVEGLATDKDMVIGLSTSGNSANVCKGIVQAKTNGAFSVAMTGGDGGNLKDLADLSVVVPSKRTARIQEAHIMIGHILCGLVEQSLFES